MRKLLAILFFVALSFSDTIDTSQVKSMNVTFTVKGTIAINGGNIISAYGNISVPQATDYQITKYSGRSAVDSNGNLYALIQAPNPSNPFTVTITTTVLTTGRTTKDLPASYTVPYEEVKYTMVTDRVQSNSPEIKELAMRITENCTDNFERIAKISRYVHDWVEYDLSYAGQWKDAVWVLDNRRGVCVEYATLFAALTRSLGIPARIIGGYAYDGSERAMIGHAWNEVYIGKWVPVDPLWDEIGYLDGGHVETARVIDKEIPDDIGATYSGGSATIITSTSNPTYKSKTTPKNVSYFEKFKDYNITSVNVTSGNSTDIELVLNPVEYRVINVKLISHCSDAVTVDGGTKMLILEQGRTTKASWNLKSNNMGKYQEYNCSISLESEYLEARDIPVSINAPKTDAVANKSTDPGQTVTPPGTEPLTGQPVTTVTETDKKPGLCPFFFVLLTLAAASFYRKSKE